MISIIIATHNRCIFLTQCLDSLTKQTLSSEKFEIIVVDNNSTDDTKAITQEFIKNNPDLIVSYVFEKEKGLSCARNRGIAEAKGDIISFIDDDATPHSKFCESLFDAGKNYPHFQAFGGKVFPVFPDDKEPAWLSKYTYGLVGKIDHGDKIIPFRKKYPYGCNMSFRKKILEELNGFNNALTYRSDDKDIFNRLKDKGYKVLYVPNIAVDHHIPESRLSRESIRRVSVYSGIGERIRHSENTIKKTAKFFDYLFKIAVSVILSIFYFLQGEKEKSLLFKIMVWNLQGYLGDEEKLFKK